MRTGPFPIHTPPFEKVSMYGVTREGLKNLRCKIFKSVFAFFITYRHECLTGKYIAITPSYPDVVFMNITIIIGIFSSKTLMHVCIINTQMINQVSPFLEQKKKATTSTM